LRQSLQPIVLSDAEARITYVNPAFTRIFGYHLDDLEGEFVTCLDPQANPAKLETSDFLRLVLTQGAFAGEIERRALDGSLIPVIANVATVYDDKDRLLGIVSSYEDLRPIKEKVSALRQLSLALEQSPESITITNLAGEIEYVNKAFEFSSGYPRAELIGRNTNILQSGNTPRETYEKMWEALANGQTWQGELFNRRKDGVEYTELAVITPIHMDDGRINQYMAVKKDITEWKKNAADL
jgi:two-component system sensor histidine kinase/response regulator